MTKLSVNINKIATIRNARGGDIPNVKQAAISCEKFGADGITVHPRPDERHIRYADVYDIAPIITTEFNIEGYPSQDFMDMVLKVKPAQVTLVPDLPHVLTSNNGWDTINHQALLREVIAELNAAGIRSSIFLNPDTNLVEAAKTAGADRIELYTEMYASTYLRDKNLAIKDYIATANLAHEMGLGINAGHDLSRENLGFFCKEIPFLAEVSIGHALISDALYLGLENTINLYKNCLTQ